MRCFVVIVFALLFIECNRPSNKANEISKIEFAKGGGLFVGEGIGIYIDSTLTYKYYGRVGKEKVGYYTGKIRPEFWDSLNQILEGIHYKTIDTSDNKQMIDRPSSELIIYWKNKKRHIIRSEDQIPDSILNVLRWISDSYKAVKLEAIKGPIKFETHFQNPPPVPKKETIDFSSPKRSKE